MTLKSRQNEGISSNISIYNKCKWVNFTHEMKKTTRTKNKVQLLTKTKQTHTVTQKACVK